MSTLITLVGWAGTLLVLVAYLLVSQRRVEADAPLYQGLNIAGALGLAANCFSMKAWPAAALNIAWLTIAAVTLFSRARKHARETKPSSTGAPLINQEFVVTADKVSR